jgi:hypothetical protein
LSSARWCFLFVRRIRGRLSSWRVRPRILRLKGVEVIRSES